MKKTTLAVLVAMLSLGLSIAFFGAAFSAPQQRLADSLIMKSPTSCPTGGCSAGQRVNFLLEFTANPQFLGGSNLQICVFAPADGTADASIIPWADYTTGWISNTGILTSTALTNGDFNNVCANNLATDEVLLAAAYAQYAAAGSDQVEFALNIAKTSNINGSVNTRVYQVDASNTTWAATANLSNAITLAAITAPTPPALLQVYVANTATDCGSNTPCFINSGDDLADGIGTGLKDAINSFSTPVQINLLGQYLIKNNSILLDQPHVVNGINGASLSTSGTTCTQNMLSITAGATLSNLIINDGICAAPSRNLIEINSATPVTLLKNTLTSGLDAIRILDNAGSVEIMATQINSNSGYGIFRASGAASGVVYAAANNIFNNRVGYQVECNNHGVMEHNYWGELVMPASATNNCQATNGRHLGAPILLSGNGAGLEAEKVAVTGTKTYAFNNRIAYEKIGGADFTLFIVNHGQGSVDNIPFHENGLELKTSCSNYWDVFLDDGTSPSGLKLYFKYDQNATCETTVESATYCGQSNQALYPLNWYDPYAQATDGWDYTGESPQGVGAGGASGQETICDTTLNEIATLIDVTGRPMLTTDLGFTPFFVGIPLTSGVTLTSFTATFNFTKIDLRWITSAEHNIKGFHILRSNQENSGYVRITNLIPSIGDSHIGGIYNFSDSDIVFSKTYYYKLEVIDNSGNSVQMLGPVSALTSTATPTATLTYTVTLTRTRTATPIIFYTSTPRPTATRVVIRTNTPVFYKTNTPIHSSTATKTVFQTAIPTGSITSMPTNDSGYPAPSGGSPTPMVSESHQTLTQTHAVENTTNQTEIQQSGTPLPEKAQTQAAWQQDDKTDARQQQIHWVFLLLGSAFGLIALTLTGWLIIQQKFFK